MTDVMQNDHYSTISLSDFFLRELETLMELQSNDTNTEKLFKKKFKDCLSSYFTSSSIVSEENILASMLDPRFKTINNETGKKYLEMVYYEEKNKEAFTAESNVSCSQPKKRRKIEELYQNRVQTSKQLDELKVYLQMEIPIAGLFEFDPLSWWNGNKKQFPILSKLVKKYLCIPATSAPSERLFSISKILTQDRRATLHPSTLNSILFLNKN